MANFGSVVVALRDGKQARRKSWGTKAHVALVCQPFDPEDGGQGLAYFTKRGSEVWRAQHDVLADDWEVVDE